MGTRDQRSADRSDAGSDGGTARERTARLLGVIGLGGLGIIAVALVALVALPRAGAPVAGSASAAPTGIAYAEVRQAPPLVLTDQDGASFSLDALRGAPALVYFGYLHCPDVCPTTVGTLNEVIKAAGDVRIVFVSIDPDRDDVAALTSYLRYLPDQYTGLTGSPQAIRRVADDWGIAYAKIENSSANGYAMGHTADVFLVDADGRLRARYPFGTEAAPIVEGIRTLGAGSGSAAASSGTGTAAGSATPAATTEPGTGSPAGTPAGTASLRPELVSTSIWAGGPSPVIVTLRDPEGVPLAGTAAVTLRLEGTDGTPAGDAVAAVPVRLPGDVSTSFLAQVTVPSPGRWRLAIDDGAGRRADLDITALDPGGTPRLGGPAPALATPTLGDVAGDIGALSTVRDPDERLYATSTAEATRAGKPYVLLIDSAEFETTPACGRALSIMRFLVDRWPDVQFIHLEPYAFRTVDGVPVLAGTLEDPPVTRFASAWGLGVAPWPATAQPWMFVVDGSGTVRASYTGIMGSDDIEIVLGEITGRGTGG